LKSIFKVGGLDCASCAGKIEKGFNNDTLAIALANVGIAIGAIGSDVAVEAADVVLMQDDWCQIAEAIKINQSTFRTIWQSQPDASSRCPRYARFLVFLNSSHLLI
jgi:cation transport ATPase